MTENKRFNLWDIEGTAFIEDHKEGSYHIGKTEDVDIDSLRNITKRLNIYAEENEQLKSFKNDVYDLIDELIKKAEKDVEDLRKDAYEKGYAYNVDGDVYFSVDK